MSILDSFTLISYIALNVDMVFQIVRIYRTKSSADLSLVGLTIRYLATFLILAKFVSLHDLPLMVGQGLILATFTVYLALRWCILRGAGACRHTSRRR